MYAYLLKTKQTVVLKALILICILIVAGCASRPQGESFSESAIKKDTHKAQITIYSTQVWASANAFLISDNTKDLAVLSRNSYFSFASPPGKLDLFADLRQTPLYLPTSVLSGVLSIATAVDAHETNKKVLKQKLASLQVKSGKQYFYKLKIHANGVDTPWPELIPVDKAKALLDLKDTKKALLPAA